MSNMWAGMRPRVPQTPNLTKQDIDALVDGLNCDAVRSQPMPAQTFSCFAPMIGCYRPHDLKRALYLAAGLTAEGERKPERVKCWLWRHPQTNRTEAISLNSPVADTSYQVTPGWFVPDGAE